MIFTAIGADASAPRPPPLTTTPTAICGLAAGAKQVNTASSRPELLIPVCAVPVLAAITMPGTSAVACAVPCGDWVTVIIIWVSSPATVGLTGWLSTVGWVVDSGVRSGAVTLSTMYGFISVPLLATAADSIASCSGVTV